MTVDLRDCVISVGAGGLTALAIIVLLRDILGVPEAIDPVFLLVCTAAVVEWLHSLSPDRPAVQPATQSEPGPANTGAITYDSAALDLDTASVFTTYRHHDRGRERGRGKGGTPPGEPTTLPLQPPTRTTDDGDTHQ